MLRRIRGLFRPRGGTRAAYRFHLRYWFTPDAEISAAVLATQRPSRALRPEISEGPTARRITVIAPHPDDEVMGPGGTLLRAKARGCAVDIVFLTDGEPDSGKAASRRAEAKRVAERLGFSTRFLGLPSNVLGPTPDAVSALATVLRELDPEVLLLPFLLDDNEDHRAASHILSEAIKSVGSRKCTEVWAYQVYGALPANVLVPLDQFADKKAEAIRMYTSQSAVRDWAHFALGLNAYNTRLAPRTCTAPYLEAFFVVPLSDYLHLVKANSKRK